MLIILMLIVLVEEVYQN